ncbi:MAG: hypothetical protein K2Q09_05925 [Phycisphaerales bacterium]|nr:hypothetical protein [Phycisphaerales bacterium]
MLSARTRVLTSTSALAVFAGMAAANPVPWFNIGPVTASRGLYGDASNVVLVTPPIPGGGPFTYLEVTGTLTEVVPATYLAEASIEVTMPSGQQFVVKPFDVVGGASGTATVFTIPLNSTFGAGGATLRFFELFRDNGAGADANWSNLTFTLHNAAGGDTTPLDSNITPVAAGPDVSGPFIVNCTKGIPSPLLIASHANPRVAGKVRLRGYGTSMAGWNANNNSNSQLSYVNINITANKADGSGTVGWTVSPFSGFAASSSQFDVTVNAPVPVLSGPGNDWAITVTEAGGASAGVGTQIARVWFSVQPLRPDAPASTDLGTLRSRPALGPVETTAVASATFARAANEVKWFTFTTEQPCSDASGYWLDINTLLPAGSPIIDQETGVYEPDGTRLAIDDDGGTGNRSLLTFGATSPIRLPVEAGPNSQRDGHSGVLPAGLHYLAVSQFNTTFLPTGWFVYSTAATAGDMNFEVRTNLPPLIPPFTELGTLGGVLPAPALANVTPSARVQWFHLTVPQPINNATRFYMDVDTIQTGGPFTDTMIALYNADGVVVGADDDDGRNGNRSQLSYGIGPANRPSIGDSLGGDGRDGNLPAGGYYVAAVLWPSSFANEWVVSAPSATASFPVNFRHNFPSTGCGPADLGSAGGVAAPDGVLNNNDFIAFITYFFASDPHADAGSAGGVVGPDGFYNNNDFIAFITLFFNGCN